MDEDLIKLFKTLSERSDEELEKLSNLVNNIITNEIKDEKVISEVFDSILSVVFIEDDKKRDVFHKLSNYCRGFDKSLADDYDEILDESLSDLEQTI